MDFALDANVIAGLLTLIVLEIVLGIDNLVFIAILADRLPPHQRDRARIIGLSLAMLMRLVLLASISWLATLTDPLVELWGVAFSGRDLILLAGGLFLLFKATTEIHERLEGGSHATSGRGHATFAAVIAQIVVLDAVFSLDSVITAVGMVDELWVMMTAVVVAMGAMMLASKPLTRFVNAHPTVVMLCLGFLLMIGLSLVAEGFGAEIPKGYLYAAIVFSIMVETFNQLRVAKQRRRYAAIPLRQRTTDAILRLMGGRADGHGNHEAPDIATLPVGAVQADLAGFSAAERSMIAGVLRLGSRSTRAVMTPHHDIAWIEAGASAEDVRRLIAEHGHSRYPVREPGGEAVTGVVMARDLLADLADGRAIDVSARMHPPLVVGDQLPVVKLIERLKTTPTRLAVAIDEHGGIEGLVTPTDLLAAIAGDLVEAEDATPAPEEQPDGSLRLEGATPLDVAAEALGCPPFPSDRSFSTLAGFILGRLGRVPDVGEGIDWEGWRFTVAAVDALRIVAVDARRIEEP